MAIDDPTYQAAYKAEMARLGREAAQKAFQKASEPPYVHKDNCMIELDPDYYGPCTCKGKTPPEDDTGY